MSLRGIEMKKTDLYMSCTIRQADGTTVCRVSGASMEKTLDIMKETARVYGSAPLEVDL